MPREFVDLKEPKPGFIQKVRSILTIVSSTIITKGIDLAPDYQAGEIVDPNAIRDAGYLFAIVQATRGTWHHPTFLEFCKPLVDAGILVMPYALFKATQNGTNQALELLEDAQLLWDYQKIKTPAFGDIEVRDGVAVSTRQQRYKDFKHTICAVTTVGTYCSYNLWQELMGNMALDPGEIGWVASWSPYATFTPPVGWPVNQIRFRQIGIAKKHDWVAPVPGMASDVDVNEFYGSVTDLYALCSSTPPCPSPPPPEEIVPMYRVQVTTTALNVRSLPSASSKDLGDLKSGDILPVVGEMDGWVRVNGWISSTYTKKV